MNKNIDNVTAYKIVRLFNLLLVVCLILTSISIHSSPINMDQNYELASIEDQMIAYYPLNGDAVDASANGNDGVVNGAVSSNDFRDMADGSLAFDGVDDDVTLESIGNWGNNLTLSFWVYANSAGQNQPHILIGSREYGNSATLVNFYVSLRDTGKMRWIIASNGINSDLETTQKFPTDQWVHVVTDWSSDTNEMNVFWDGELVSTGDIGDTPRFLTSSDIGIGHFCNGCSSGSSFFEGRIDELRIHSRLLGLSEISTLAGVTATYPLDGNALDSSGNQRDGVIHGAQPTIGVFGETDTAYEFDGIDDLIDTPAYNNWGDELAFSMWYKADSNSAGEGQVLIGSRSPGSGSTLADFVLIINSNLGYTWKIYSSGTNSQVVSDAGIASFDKWTHIAVDWSRLTGNMRLFIDGELIGSTSSGAAPRYLGYSVGIGNYNIDYDNTRAPFHGKLDQVKVFNRVFTEQEVLRLADVIYKNNFEI